MEKVETILEYYQATNRRVPIELLSATDAGVHHFNILKRQKCLLHLPYQRRDYFKICVTTGNAILLTDKGEITIDKPAVFFSNPTRKFGWKTITADEEGYVCLFNEKYLTPSLKKEIKQLAAAFSNSVYPFLFLDKEQLELFFSLFRMMQKTYCSAYPQKHSILRNLLSLMIHHGIHIQSQLSKEEHHSTDRLVNAFFDLLNNQFPVDAPTSGISYTSPDDFAQALHVHVNHLNHSLKKATGSTTSQLIQERIVAEAIDLLSYSDWNISEIGFSLGFEYPQHFNYLFKKHTGKSPKSFRQRQPE
jgi:AraC family transcriptional regulator, transcriptional activator of pobA